MIYGKNHHTLGQVIKKTQVFQSIYHIINCSGRPELMAQLIQLHSLYLRPISILQRKSSEGLSASDKQGASSTQRSKSKGSLNSKNHILNLKQWYLSREKY